MPRPGATPPANHSARRCHEAPSRAGRASPYPTPSISAAPVPPLPIRVKLRPDIPLIRNSIAKHTCLDGSMKTRHNSIRIDVINQLSKTHLIAKSRRLVVVFCLDRNSRMAATENRDKLRGGSVTGCAAGPSLQRRPENHLNIQFIFQEKSRK